MDARKSHYSPQPSVIVQCYLFHTRFKRPEEYVATFLSELHALVQHCNFGATLDDMIRDRLVCGIGNDLIQRRLLSEADITLDSALKLALSYGSAVRTVRELQTCPATSIVAESGVHKVDHTAGQQPTGARCYRCGRKTHISAQCPHREAKCINFKKGHIRSACRSRPQEAAGGRDPRVKQVWPRQFDPAAWVRSVPSEDRKTNGTTRGTVEGGRAVFANGTGHWSSSDPGLWVNIQTVLAYQTPPGMYYETAHLFKRTADSFGTATDADTEWWSVCYLTPCCCTGWWLQLAVSWLAPPSQTGLEGDSSPSEYWRCGKHYLETQRSLPEGTRNSPWLQGQDLRWWESNSEILQSSHCSLLPESEGGRRTWSPRARRHPGAGILSSQLTKFPSLADTPYLGLIISLLP